MVLLLCGFLLDSKTYIYLIIDLIVYLKADCEKVFSRYFLC